MTTCSSGVGQHPPPQRVKKVLAIVDPDTNTVINRQAIDQLKEEQQSTAEHTVDMDAGEEKPVDCLPSVGRDSVRDEEQSWVLPSN